MFYFQKWARIPFLHSMACSLCLFAWISAYTPRIEVSKPRGLCIWHTSCNHIALDIKCMYLHYIIGNDNSTTNFQQNPSLFLQECVSLLWGFCMWLGFAGSYSSSRMVHLHYICICSCMVALCLTQTDSSMLSTNSRNNEALHFQGIPLFMWLVPTEFSISLESTFPSIYWIFDADPQHEGETCVWFDKWCLIGDST